MAAWSLIKQRGITQVQLAQALNVSQQTTQACAVVRRRIPVSTLRALARTLGVRTGSLLAAQQECASAYGYWA